MKRNRSSKFNEQDLEAALLEVIDPDDRAIVIYSGIWTFGHRLAEISSATTVTERIFDVIDSVVGPDRTVLFPTFTNQFVKTRHFDLRRDESDCSGVLAKFAMHSPGFRRSRQPLHSYTVKGPMSQDVLDRPCTTAWGDDSILAWMEEVDARIVPLGLPWQNACSYFHRIEEQLSVPYRYFKRFAGTLLENGQVIGDCQEIKYSYSLNVGPQFDHSGVVPIMKEMEIIRKCDNPLIPIQSSKTKALSAATHHLFNNNIYAYVKNRAEVEAWVQDGKAAEVAALAPSERWPQS